VIIRGACVARVLCAAIPFLILAPLARSAGCGDTEQDRIVWARERMRDGISQQELRLVYQWLLNGTSSCNDSGDLWFYRSLVATRLNNARDATYALTKSKEYHSKAQQDGFNPFTPPARIPAPVPVGFTRPRNKYALLVGVTSLQNSFDSLEFSGKDASDVGEYLVKEAGFPRENVQVLTDEKATTRNIREAFGRIRAKAKAEDMVVVYISSHGRPRTLDPTGLSYVLTYDTDMGTQAKTFATALQMVELAELGRWTLARDYVLLLDTCYSGSAKPGAVTGDTDPLQGLQGSGNRAVIAASQENEKSYEDREHRHGYFTRFLLDGLSQKRDIPLAALYDYVRAHVVEAVSGDRQQHPVARYFGAANSIQLEAPIESAFNIRGSPGLLAFLPVSAAAPATMNVLGALR
jgi:hypothetical protein